MELNYIAFTFLIAAFGFAYLMKKVKIRFSEIWLICAVICSALYILFMFMNGDALLDTALGLTVLAIAVLILNYREDEQNCCLTQLNS